jgi:hypothetical protein
MKNQLSTANFCLGQNHTYVLEQVIPVYLHEREIVGYATVKSKRETELVQLDGVRVPRNEISFELDEKLQEAGRAKYSPYFAGRSGKLCVSDNEAREKSERTSRQRQLDQVRKLSLDYRYACLSCKTVTGSSKEIKRSTCIHCRKGRLEKVSSW